MCVSATRYTDVWWCLPEIVCKCVWHMCIDIHTDILIYVKGLSDHTYSGYTHHTYSGYTHHTYSGYTHSMHRYVYEKVYRHPPGDCLYLSEIVCKCVWYMCISKVYRHRPPAPNTTRKKSAKASSIAILHRQRGSKLTFENTAPLCTTLQHTATCCSCATLHHTAPHCNAMHWRFNEGVSCRLRMCASMFIYHRSLLQKSPIKETIFCKRCIYIIYA